MPIIGNMPARSVVDQLANTSIQTTLSNLKSGNESSKTCKAARDFESILLSSWLEKMEETFSAAPGADADPGHDNFQGMGLQAVASTISNSGGIGIADLIMKNLQKSGTEVTTSATANSESR